MKTTIYITKQLVLSLLFLLAGGYCTLYGAVSLYREGRCIPLEELSSHDCPKGAYVAGTMESCVTVNVDGKDMGSCGGYITLGGAVYECYTIPMADARYIRIMLRDKDTVDGAEELIAGARGGVYVEGQIAGEMMSFNDRWYEKAARIRNPRGEVLQNEVIRQISFGRRRNFLYLGIEILAITVLAMWKGRILHHSIDSERPCADASAQGVKAGYAAVRGTWSYNMSNEMTAEERKIRMLERRLAGYRKSCICGAVMLAAGVGLLLTGRSLFVWLLGLIMIVFSVKAMLRYLLNLGYGWSEKVMRLFGRESIAGQIRMCDDRMVELARRITNKAAGGGENGAEEKDTTPYFDRGR